MSLSGNWSGKIVGTNKGNIYIEIAQNKDKIFGKLHINDLDLGVANYHFEGTVLNNKVEMTMFPQMEEQIKQSTMYLLMDSLQMYPFLKCL